LPDIIAWIRIALTPVIMALVLADGSFAGSWGWALAIFTIAAVSDFVDGFLARRWEITTTLGAFLDTIADKILVTGTLIALVAVGRAWAWAAFVIIVREIAVMGLRGVAGVQGITVMPSRVGKLKAVAQFVAMAMAIVRTADQWGPLYPDEWMMLVAVALTIGSAVDYFIRFATVVRST
jgi:CDP-diacylglycerol--glycerol-3-phosphate 3-phosphatidyltransferase